MGEPPEAAVAAGAVIDKEPFEGFAASRTEENHGLVNTIEDRLSRVWRSSVAPPTARFCLFEIGHEPQEQLGALLLCPAAADERAGVSLLKQRSRSLRDGQEARGRTFHLD